MARANNALFGAQAAYDELVPAFEALFERESQKAPGNPWPRFYAAVRRIAALPAAERRQALLAPESVARQNPALPLRHPNENGAPRV